MEIPFTSKEIKEAVNLLKNNKSTGCDGISAELLKQSPETIYDMIAEIYNETASTGERPKELLLGTVCAIQKPGKKKGPIANLRPITLLSMLRKMLAICMKKRIIDHLDDRIPPSQAAYHKGKSTTEHVFATKVLAEKAITSKNHPIFIIMLDMSKTFDTVNRNILLTDPDKVINTDEIHLISMMLETHLQIKWGNSFSETFDTNTGVPQGDGLSANQFTFYLSQAMREKHQDHTKDP